MDLNKYQEEAMRSKGGTNTFDEALILGGLGVSGEAGEVTDYIKKVIFHGRELDKNNLAKELGDILWYMAFLADTIEMTLSEIAAMNIEKLHIRYPNGFSNADSLERRDVK